MAGSASPRAASLSPSALSLSDDGRLGVKTVDETNKVVFMPVSIARAEERSVWLTGLPDQIRVITVGQGFVRDGSHVRPIPEASITAEPMVSEVAR